MNNLKQLPNYLLGAETACAELAKKKSARILVVSDSHGQPQLLHTIIRQLGPGCDAFVFCGDGICDFVACMDTASADGAFAECVPPVAAFVEGNGDSDLFPARFNPGTEPDSADKIYYELKIPKHVLLKAAGHTIYIVHGNVQGVYYGTEQLQEEAAMAGADIALYGHTHITDETRLSSVYFVNPGSCSHPRGGQPPSCAVLELDGRNTNAVFYKIDIKLNGTEFIPYFPEKRTQY